MASLTKEHRDALPDSDFAVPETRDMPMHDATHVKMAWKMVDRTKGLSPAQRSTARKRIIHKAHELGVDTSDWDTGIEAMQFMAMSLNMPEQKEHPNKMPFKGVLCKIDEPSDAPPSGARGRRSFISHEVAEKSIESLLGMAVDFTPDFDGHDRQNKIGIITEAYIESNNIIIEGFLYSADFPEETKRIQAEKNLMGLSYEAQGYTMPMGDDLVAWETCFFTGAAILYKDRAAYTTTSLAAAKSKTESKEMSEQDKKEMQETIKAMQETITALSKKAESLEAAQAEAQKVSASSVSHLVKPHTDAIRAAANSMCAAGIGNHQTGGHGAMLHRMADSMDAEAVLGRMPHVYRDHDFLMNSNEGKKTESIDAAAAKMISEFKESVDAKFDSITTMVSDLKKANFSAAAEPERKTLSPALTALLAKNDIVPEQDSGKVSKKQVSEVLSGLNLNPTQKAKYITELHMAGKI